MLDAWLETLDSVLRPSRPNAELCARELETHLASRQRISEARARAIASCERRIESARAAVFAADDGVVTLRMTELEREWRLLSRRDTDDGLMDLWARIGPRSWIDRKRWRDTPVHSGARLDMALGLAADPDGVEAAEAAVAMLRSALAPWGKTLGARICWRPLDETAIAASSSLIEDLLGPAEHSAREALAATDARDVILERASRLEDEVDEAARARMAERHHALATSFARAALVDYLWGAVVDLRLDASQRALVSPVSALRSLWKTGYVLGSNDATSVTLLADLSVRPESSVTIV